MFRSNLENRRPWFSRFTFLALLALISLGCNLSLSLPLAATTPTPPAETPTPIATVGPTPVPPTSGPDNDLNLAALIDAFGRDFAEQRIIEVYERVSPAVVSITTQVLQRNFFFELIPAEGVGSGFVLDRKVIF